jgi:hypothetical protein
MGDDIISPDGRIRISFSCSEMRMSHWICTPVIQVDGATILDMTAEFGWDAEAKFDEDGKTINMYLRKYPGDKPGFDVRIDTDLLTVAFLEEPEFDVALSEFMALLEVKHRQQKRTANDLPG